MNEADFRKSFDDVRKNIWRSYQKNTIVEKETGSSTKNVLICFSSNGLYYPNTEKEFYKRIIKENRYEWQNVTKNRLFRKKFKKIIYVRDLYKQWYLPGINSSCDSIEKTIELLREKCNDYDVYTMGSSSGGWMALLCGILLKAKAIYSLSPQIELFSDTDLNDLFRKDCYTQWLSLEKIVFSNEQSKIFLFYSNRWEKDVEQANMVKGAPLFFPFAMSSNVHGVPVIIRNIPWLIGIPEEKLICIWRQLSTSGIEIKQMDLFERVAPSRVVKRYVLDSWIHGILHNVKHFIIRR